jgi:Fe-only nitrogenase accessory protein AnfO
MKIAVAENSEKKTGSIFEPGFIACFSDESGAWSQIDRFENTVHEAETIAGVRNELKEIVKKLADTRILVAAELSGVAFSIFEGAGYEIFTADAETSAVLDKIKQEMEEAEKRREENPRSANIQLYIKRGMNRGDYFLNLIELLAENPQSTTKSVLIPYLKEGDFTRFDVVCGHIPPWFDREFPAMGLAYETVNVLPDKKTVRITHL